MAKASTGLYEDYQNGQLTLCSDDEKLLEIRTIIQQAADIDTRVVSDHIINLLQGIEGHIVLDRRKMLDMIDGYLDQPEHEKRLYQAARRMALVNGPQDMIPGSEPHRPDRSLIRTSTGSLRMEENERSDRAVYLTRARDFEAPETKEYE